MLDFYSHDQLPDPAVQCNVPVALYFCSILLIDGVSLFCFLWFTGGSIERRQAAGRTPKNNEKIRNTRFNLLDNMRKFDWHQI